MASLSHILAADPDEPADEPAPDTTSAAPMPPSRKPLDDNASDEEGTATPQANNSVKADDDRDDEQPYNASSTTVSTRRNASGATSSVYSGNKIRHLKKEDGIPLWRKDIQYDFLKLVFYDKTQCFTKYSDGTKGHTFADIYIDAMAKSSKCSKILKEKLLQDQEGAISMAMVCLLVNVGRMNTTLNFFPEMRAQLRTYHSIPALQAHQDPNAYKQLQDAPRLKSILKGATEDEPQPSTMEDIKLASIPRTNPVNLIFVMSQYAPKISEVHFPPPRDFFDLVMRSSLSSASRARAFLWLIWWYLESDFSKYDSQRNPFGPGQYGEGEEGTDALPIKVPTLDSLTEEQAAEENVDTEGETHFGEVKRKERIAILASEPSPAMTALKRARKEKGLTTGHGAHFSDDEGSETGYQRPIPTSTANVAHKSSNLHHETGSDYTRSPSPVASRGFQAVNAKPAGMGINNLLNSDDVGPEQSPPAPAAPAPVKKGPGRGNWRRHKKTDPSAASGGRAAQDAHHIPLLPNTGQLSFVSDGPQITAQNLAGNKLMAATGMSPGSTISFAAPTHIPTPSYQAQKRHRGITQHQSAVINHRRMQIEYTLDRRIRKEHIKARRMREGEGAMLRAWKRIRCMPPDYDSEEEAVKIRKARDRAEKNEDDWRAVRGAGKDEEGFLEDVNAWRRPKVLFAGFMRTNGEGTDFGEEAKTLASSFRKASRRLDRWGETRAPGQAILRRKQMESQSGTKKRRSVVSGSFDEDGDGSGVVRAGMKRARSGTARRDAEEDGDGNGAELDEEDRELLGEVDADESEDEDEEMY